MAGAGRDARGRGDARGAFLVFAAVHDGPVVIIDNYDSFTYNLSQVRTLHSEPYTLKPLNP